MSKEEFLKQIEQFCQISGIRTKKEFAELFGLSHGNRVYDLPKSNKAYHVAHFKLLKEVQRLTGKTGQGFINYIKSLG